MVIFFIFLWLSQFKQGNYFYFIKLNQLVLFSSIHRPRDSLFSWSSGFQDFEGVMNWAFLLLTLGGLRLVLENLNK